MYVGGDLDFSVCKTAMQAIAVGLVAKTNNFGEFTIIVRNNLVGKDPMASVAFTRFVARFASFRTRVTWQAVEDFFEELPHSNDKAAVSDNDLPVALRALVVGIRDDLHSLLSDEQSNGVADLGFRLFAYIIHFMLQDEKHDLVREFVAGATPQYLLKRINVMSDQFP